MQLNTLTGSILQLIERVAVESANCRWVKSKLAHWQTMVSMRTNLTMARMLSCVDS